MKTYYIFLSETDEVIGEVLATSVLDAEYKACGLFNVGSLEIYALSADLLAD